MAVIGHFHCRSLCTAAPALARLDRHSVAAVHRALRAPWAARGRRRLHVGCVRCRFLLIFVKKNRATASLCCWVRCLIINPRSRNIISLLCEEARHLVDWAATVTTRYADVALWPRFDCCLLHVHVSSKGQRPFLLALKTGDTCHVACEARFETKTSKQDRTDAGGCGVSVDSRRQCIRNDGRTGDRCVSATRHCTQSRNHSR